MDKLKRDILDFIVFLTYKSTNVGGNPARIPIYILQANFTDPNLDNAINDLVEQKLITPVSWDVDKNLGTNCTEKGANLSNAIISINLHKKRKLIITENSIYVEETE